MSSKAMELYWQAIASSRGPDELRAAIGADRERAGSALREMRPLLAAFEPIRSATAVHHLEWLATELAAVSGDRQVWARFQARSCLRQAMDAITAGKKTEAIRSCIEALTTSLEADSLLEMTTITRLAASLLFRLGESEASMVQIEAFMEVLDKRDPKDAHFAVRDLARLTALAPATGRWIKVLERLRAAMEQIDDATGSATVGSHLAATLVRMGAYESALQLLDEVLPILNRFGVKGEKNNVMPLDERAAALLWRARALDLANQEMQAEAAYRSHPFLTEGSPDEHAEVISRLVEFLIENHRLQEALDLLQSSQPQSQKYAALAQAMAAFIYALLNQPNLSAAAREQAVALLDEARAPAGESTFQRLLAETSRRIDALYAPDEACWRTRLACIESEVVCRAANQDSLATLHRALTWTRQNGERALEARCLRLKGEIALAAGNAQSAVADLELSLELEMTSGALRWAVAGEPAQPGAVHNDLWKAQVRGMRVETGVGMETRLALGRAQALAGVDPVATWDAVIGAAQRRNRRLTLYSALAAKAHWLKANGRQHEAGLLWEQAADILENLRADLKSVDAQIAALENKEACYGELLFAAVEARDGARAMRLMERAKARALLEAMHARENFRPLDAANEQDARNLRQQLVRALKQQMEGNDPQGMNVERLKNRLASAYRRSLPAQRAGFQPGARAVDVEQFSAKAAVVQYFLCDDMLIISVARDGRSMPPLTIPRGKIWFGELLSRFEMERDELTDCPSLRDLYAVLIQPVEGVLEGATQLILVPHGILHMLPIHAAQSANGVFLIQKFAIQYAPSVAVAIHARRIGTRPAPAGALLIAGNYTPYTSLPELQHAVAEVNQLAKFVPAAQVFAQNAAVRRHIVRRNVDLDILHLACHGEFDYHDPLLSRIYLADGPLYGYEIERLSFRPRLAVLSACETAVHRRLAGDETFGLVRAWLSCGAESVVASLWKVAESTAELMAAFYHQLGRGAGVTQALQAAQRSLLSSPRFGHPFFWAPYIATGAGEVNGSNS
jgi:hypothetical protein